MSVILGKFRIMATKQSVRGGWSGVATGVRRSRVPLVLYNESKHNILALVPWVPRQGQQNLLTKCGQYTTTTTTI
jgi:hypothetical protein